MIKNFTILLISQICFFAASAQNDSLASKYLNIYKENRDFSYTSPKGELGGPTKFVLTGRLTTNYFLLNTPKIPISFALVPDFTVKVIDEKSAGVRTPSLKLGGVLYYSIGISSQSYSYTTLKFTHHSNGQDGEALNPDGTINTRNGNFSTNYLTVSYHFGSVHNPFREKQNTLHHDAGLQWNKWFDYEKALENDYGFTRLIYNFSWRKYNDEKENWRLNAGLNYAVNKMDAYKLRAIKKRLNAETSFHYSFPFMKKAFLMAAAGYYGEDPYNIYYRDKYAYLRFGVSTGL